MTERLSTAQLAFLKMLEGTKFQRPYRQHRAPSLFNPTGKSLERRGLAKWRGYHAPWGCGGWYITADGKRAYKAQTFKI